MNEQFLDAIHKLIVRRKELELALECSGEEILNRNETIAALESHAACLEHQLAIAVRELKQVERVSRCPSVGQAEFMLDNIHAVSFQALAKIDAMKESK